MLSFAETIFLDVETKDDFCISLTDSHIIFTVDHEPMFARDLKIGDRLLVWEDSAGEVVKSTITSIRESQGSGYWSPFTTQGTLLVNNVLASCYASYPHWSVYFPCFIDKGLFV